MMNSQVSSTFSLNLVRTGPDKCADRVRLRLASATGDRFYREVLRGLARASAPPAARGCGAGASARGQGAKAPTRAAPVSKAIAKPGASKKGHLRR